MRITKNLPDGSTLVFEADDPEALGKALAVYERERFAKPEPVQVAGDPWDQFFERVAEKPEQLKVLHLLKEQGPFAFSQLADLLGVENTRDLGGLLGAIRRTTLRSGFGTTDDVITKKRQMYLPGPALLKNLLPPMPSRKTRWDHLLDNLEEEDEP